MKKVSRRQFPGITTKAGAATMFTGMSAPRVTRMIDSS